MLKIGSASTLKALKPRVVCKRYIPMIEGAVSMIYSMGGVGKSFAAITQAMYYVIETGNKVALWLTEDPEGENRDRYERLLGEFASTDRGFFDSRISFVTNTPIKIIQMRDGNAELTDDFLDIQIDLIDYGMVVIDPLLQFQGCDENSNTHAGVFMGAMKDWAEREDKSILLLHHATKTRDGKPSPRGASEWVNATRACYLIGYPADEEAAKFHRVFELVKDNGVGYVFMNPETKKKEQLLKVFPPFAEKQPDRDYRKIRMSVANHNDHRNPKGFEQVEVSFESIHIVVRENKCYSPYMFAGGHRKNENNLGFSDILCLDFDSGMTLLQAEQKFSTVKSLFVTTRSHQKDGKGDRFRVFMKLKTPLIIPAEDHKDFMSALFEYIGSVDPATKDMARFFFASPPEAQYWYSKSDKEFDWKPFYNKVKKKKILDAIKVKRDKPKDTKTYTKGIKSNELSKDAMLTTQRGSTHTFSSFKDSLGHGEKAVVQCRHGIAHADTPQSVNASAVIFKEDNGNVSYWCSGGRCGGESKKLYCEED